MNTIKSVGQRFAAWFTGEPMNQNRISFFDVKALYDAAFEEKDKAQACLEAYKSLMAQAEALDGTYRAQIAADHAARYGKAA